MKEVIVAGCVFNMTQEAYDLNKITVDGVDLPMPSELPFELNDVDVDAYTNIYGYTVRNRVRSDVNSISIKYNVLTGEEYYNLLNTTSKVWMQVEYFSPRENRRVSRKMYRSPLVSNRYYMEEDFTKTYYTDIDFSFVEE